MTELDTIGDKFYILLAGQVGIFILSSRDLYKPGYQP
jgi:hypothetical protein